MKFLAQFQPLTHYSNFMVRVHKAGLKSSCSMLCNQYLKGVVNALVLWADCAISVITVSLYRCFKCGQMLRCYGLMCYVNSVHRR